MRPENDERIEDFQRVRKLAEGFVAGEIEFVPFYEGLTSILGATFDGLDSQLQGLPDAVQREVQFYSDWTGGEWSETEDRFPQRSDWAYGEDLEPYGWIDKEAYRQEFAAAFELLERLDFDARDA